MRGPSSAGFTRRRFLRGALLGGLAGGSAWTLMHHLRGRPETVFIGRAESYREDLVDLLLRGFSELEVTGNEIRGKTILLKPNLVEPHDGRSHINTNPALAAAAAEAFLKMGAGRVLIGEGPGHRRDTLLVLELSGFLEVLRQMRLSFADLNDDAEYELPNASPMTRLKTLSFSSVLSEADWIVSMPKMKTHHWAGITLSMKNLFGLMPGIVYGWPKNVLHYEGITESILAINATLRPHFSIVDGILGMEGDGPIMGTPRRAGVLVMGRNSTSVDATSARIMGINPNRVPYLALAEDWLGPISENRIRQTGEDIPSVRTDFALLDNIPAHRGLRLQ